MYNRAATRSAKHCRYRSEREGILSSSIPEYPLEELVYASGYEKMYGITDEAYRYYRTLQYRLGRFDAEPALSEDRLPRLKHLEEKRDRLAPLGFDPLYEEGLPGSLIARFAYGTMAIEGSRLSLPEVEALLRGDGAPAGGPSAAVETRDVAAGFEAAMAQAAAGRILSVPLICETHRIAAAHLPDAEPGELRYSQVHLTGSPTVPPPPSMVGSLLERAVDRYNEAPSLPRAAGFHLVFEDIHPFTDGNGRTGRIILNYMLAGLGYPPIVLGADEESRAAYRACFPEFTCPGSTRSCDAMFDLLADSLDRSIAEAIATAGKRQGVPARTTGRPERGGDGRSRG